MLNRCRGVMRVLTVAGPLGILSAGSIAAGAAPNAAKKPAPVGQPAVSIENDDVKYVIGTDGRSLHFIDKRTGVDYADAKPGSSLAHVRIGKQSVQATSVSSQGGQFEVRFGKTGVSAVLKPIVYKHYLVLEVVSLRGKGVEAFTFIDIPLTLKATPDEPFVASALALNLKTNVRQIPQPSRRLTATCYPRFGFVGARVGLIGCPRGVLRDVMKEAVAAAPDLPKSRVGGPWALDAPINKGSYLFNFGGMSEQTVDQWIKLARDLGISQIDFHGGSSFRFGDCRPNPKTYPKGYASLKAVIDRLHAAGIKAGLHTYAFFINKGCPWVTPKPDPRLGTFRSFTLAAAVTADAAVLPVAESTKDVSTTIGFFVRNSVTLRIDDELITFRGVAKAPPYAFTGCKRGACGTTAAAHAAGAKAHHLKECFGLFTPDADSTLLAEVAAKTAEAYNRCGFDMMYMDALDGEDILGGGENGWHYGSKFVFEVVKRIDKPGPMEMSTFHHHLWYVRGRMGAMDHPTRSHKKFIDFHSAGNRSLRRMFLPGHLGWWALKPWTGHQGEPTFADDIEYLCCKCIGTDVGLSIMGVSPGQIDANPVYGRLAGILKRYEGLRHKNVFDPTLKAKLAEPGKDYTLFQDPDGRWRFRRMHYAKHKVEGINGWSNVWSTGNPFAAQPVQLRIEALMSAGPYDAPGNVTVADFADAKAFDGRASAKGVTLALATTSDRVKAGKVSGVLTATNANKTTRRGTWTRAVKTFEPALNLSKRQGLGVWVHGDGQGEVLNFQLKSPHHISHGIGDHYVVVDFTGWRYFELIEPEGERHSRYAWPYGGLYSIYRESVRYGQVASLGLWCNNLPANGKAVCSLSPIRAVPLVSATLVNPAVTIGGKRIVFPVKLKSGSYLEFHSPSDCKAYGPKGDLIGPVKPQGDVPSLRAGDNEVAFTCDGPTDVSARARVTVISKGPTI